MKSHATRALLVIVMAGSSLALAPQAEALTWIVRPDHDVVGAPPGSDQPCERAAGGGASGASAQRLANGECWIVLPDAAAEHVNPNAVEPWDDTP
jgi:hypothetical protein